MLPFIGWSFSSVHGALSLHSKDMFCCNLEILSPTLELHQSISSLTFSVSLYNFPIRIVPLRPGNKTNFVRHKLFGFFDASNRILVDCKSFEFVHRGYAYYKNWCIYICLKIIINSSHSTKRRKLKCEWAIHFICPRGIYFYTPPRP